MCMFLVSKMLSCFWHLQEIGRLFPGPKDSSDSSESLLHSEKCWSTSNHAPPRMDKAANVQHPNLEPQVLEMGVWTIMSSSSSSPLPSSSSSPHHHHYHHHYHNPPFHSLNFQQFIHLQLPSLKKKHHCNCVTLNRFCLFSVHKAIFS